MSCDRQAYPAKRQSPAPLRSRARFDYEDLPGYVVVVIPRAGAARILLSLTLDPGGPELFRTGLRIPLSLRKVAFLVS